MRSTERVIAGNESKDVIDFLARLRDAQELVVQLEGESFVVTIKRLKVSTEGRAILGGGGPVDGND